MSTFETINVANGQQAEGAVAANGPVRVGATYNSSPPAPSSGQVVSLQLDSSGNLKTNVSNAIAAGTAGSPSTNVVSVQGQTGMTPLQVTPYAGTTGGSSYNNAIAPATPASTNVKTSAGNVVGVRAFNSGTSPVWVKFFDVATVTLGTTNCNYQFMIPAGGGFVAPITELRSHANKIIYAVTGAIATNDDTAITANTVVVDVSFN